MTRHAALDLLRKLSIRPSPSLDRIYQLGLWSAIFFAIFLRLPPNKSSDSAGPFTSFDPVGFAIFATHAHPRSWRLM
jgi:hypothetical protein